LKVSFYDFLGDRLGVSGQKIPLNRPGFAGGPNC
jgi:hypothetical protein